MIYVASPYTNDDNVVTERRFILTEDYVASLFQQKLWAFSPIVHCHALAKEFRLPTDADYWKEYNLHMLARADVLHVLRLSGWENSEGVKNEIFFWKALKHNPEIIAVQPESHTKIHYCAEHLLAIMEAA